MTADRVSPRAWRVLAPNPGPMTLEGTNTWVLRQDGAAEAVVVDPGPADPGHLDRVAAVAGRVALILLTHRHPDHAEAAPALAARTGAPVVAAVDAGPVVVAADLRLSVVATPGHTADSGCLLLAADGALLTGDTVLGRGSSVVAHPDGRLADYLDSLDRLLALPGVTVLLPGHGPVHREPRRLIEAYRRHRLDRLAEVRDALAGGARTAAEVVEAVYREVPAELRSAALSSAVAQLDYLAERGEAGGISRSGGTAGPTGSAASTGPGPAAGPR